MLLLQLINAVQVSMTSNTEWNFKCKEICGVLAATRQLTVRKKGTRSDLRFTCSWVFEVLISKDTDHTLDEEDCKYYFHEALDGCDTKTTTEKLGGTVNDECFSYLLHPQDFDGDLNCSPFQTVTGPTHQATMRWHLLVMRSLSPHFITSLLHHHFITTSSPLRHFISPSAYHLIWLIYGLIENS